MNHHENGGRQRTPFERLMDFEPDPELLAANQEIERLMMRIKDLQQVSLLQESRYVASKMVTHILSRFPGLNITDPAVEEMKSRMAEAARLGERVEELRARIDPNYAHRLARTRQRVERMRQLLNTLYPPQHDIFK